MAYKIASLDALGDGYGFRKVRAPLGVTAFGVNGLVFPPGYEGPNHYHDTRTSCTSSTAAPRRSRSTARSTRSARAASSTSSRRRTASISNRTRRRPRTCSSSAARAATSSATATWSTPEDLAKRQAMSRELKSMNGLMMDYQLTLPTLLRRSESYYGGKEIVTRLPDKSFHRTTYAETCRRARALAVALQRARARARRPRRDALLEPPRSITRRTSASRAAGSCCTRSTCACIRTTSPTSRRTRATAR